MDNPTSEHEKNLHVLWRTCAFSKEKKARILVCYVDIKDKKVNYISVRRLLFLIKGYVIDLNILNSLVIATARIKGETIWRDILSSC